MTVNQWTPQREKIFTYLWYLGVDDMALVEKFTHISQEECYAKYVQLPKGLPKILKHESNLNAFPQMLLRTALSENFEIVENKICRTGLFTSDKVYALWLKISSENSQPVQSTKIWTEHQEKIMAYLWYAGIKTGTLASEFTGMTIKQCHSKWLQFPGMLPDQLQHDYKINEQKFTTFEELQKHLSQQGLKTVDQVYDLWKNTYSNAYKVKWSSSELTKLCKAVFFSEKLARGRISWAKITEVFTNKTQTQCEHAYKIHTKKMSTSPDRISKPKGSSRSKPLCTCFLKSGFTQIKEQVDCDDIFNEQNSSLDFAGEEFNRNDMLDPTYTPHHQSPFFDIPMDLNFPEEVYHSPLHIL